MSLLPGRFPRIHTAADRLFSSSAQFREMLNVSDTRNDLTSHRHRLFTFIATVPSTRKMTQQSNNDREGGLVPASTENAGEKARDSRTASYFAVAGCVSTGFFLALASRVAMPANRPCRALPISRTGISSRLQPASMSSSHIYMAVGIRWRIRRELRTRSSWAKSSASCSWASSPMASRERPGWCSLPPW